MSKSPSIGVWKPVVQAAKRIYSPARPPDKGDATDHPHQTSAWFCHGDVIPEGIELTHKVKGVKGVDYWSIAPGHGKMVCVKVQFNAGTSPVDTWNEWRTADDVKVLDE